jgi:diguanylate cyclase (GGDEF)-like protein
MLLRPSAESRTIVAFFAGVAALVFAAWLALTSVHAYVADEQRIDRLLDADGVLSRLSSTSAGPASDEARDRLTRSVHAEIARLRAERDAARHHREAIERATALLGVLAIALYWVAHATTLRAQRERRRLEDRLQDETQHDALTGLPNRRFFAEWLSYAIAHARRENGHVGVLFLDIAGCATVAELHGGPAVEALLVEVARRFRTASREGEVSARLGANEFALATPNVRDGRELALLAQRLRDALNDPSLPPLADTPIGTSIGIAFFPEDAGDSAGIIAAANAAMYAARRAGRNHVAFNALAA